MGLWDRLFGWRKYYDQRFEEFLKIIREGFSVRDKRVEQLEKRRPTPIYVTQKVSLSQEEFNIMLKEALKNKDISQELILEAPSTEISEPEIAEEPPVLEHVHPQPLVPAEALKPIYMPEPQTQIRTIEYRKEIPKKLKPVLALLFNSNLPITANNVCEHFPRISIRTARTYLYELNRIIPLDVILRPDRKKEYSLTAKTRAEILTSFGGV